MTFENWMTWTQNQMADLSLSLLRQGYTPARIGFLQETSTLFSERYDFYMGRMMDTVGAMEHNPDGYHHFEDFTNAKDGLLNFTCEHRSQFLQLELAQTA